MKRASDLLDGLPGEELLRQGLTDFHSGNLTAPVFLVAIARSRLAQAGLIERDNSDTIPEPELHLYRMLRAEGGGADAYSRYNALLRELVSFEQALDQRLTRKRDVAGS